MSEKSIEEYTEKMRERYARMTGRKARSKMLDEFIEVTGWERKHANKVLLGHKRKSGSRGKRGGTQTIRTASHRHPQGIRQTRSRPYFKNDQAYVEQKNHTHVRGLLGYDRLEHQELLPELNELLSLWSLWKNLCCVTTKQESCHREGSKQVRRHSKKNHTPAQRLLNSGKLSAVAKKRIKTHLHENDPFQLKAETRLKEDGFWSKRTSLMQRDEDQWLASEGCSPLRSEQPSEAPKQPPTQEAL